MIARAATEVLNRLPLGAGALALELAANLGRMGSAGDLGPAGLGTGMGEFLQLPPGELRARLPFAADEATDPVNSELLLGLKSIHGGKGYDVAFTHLPAVFWATSSFLGLHHIVRNRKNRDSQTLRRLT